MMKRFERVALWTGTVLSGIGAICFAINAGATLLNHPDRTGELYGMATAAAIFAFITSYLRSRIREGNERDDAALPGVRAASALVGAGAPGWGGSSISPAEAAPLRLERDCPYCAERILVAAKLCKHCHSDVSSA